MLPRNQLGAVGAREVRPRRAAMLPQSCCLATNSAWWGREKCAPDAPQWYGRNRAVAQPTRRGGGARSAPPTRRNVVAIVLPRNQLGAVGAREVRPRRAAMWLSQSCCRATNSARWARAKCAPDAPQCGRGFSCGAKKNHGVGKGFSVNARRGRARAGAYARPQGAGRSMH